MVNYVIVEYSDFRYPRGYHSSYSFRGAFRGTIRAGFRGGRPYLRGNWRGRGNISVGVHNWGAVQHRTPQRGGYQRDGPQREDHQRVGPQRGQGYHVPEGVGGLNRKQRRIVAAVLTRDAPVEQRPLLKRALMDALPKRTCNRASANDQPNEEEQPQEQEQRQEQANEHLQEQANEQPQEQEPANWE